MQPPQQHSRVNLADLKGQIIKKLGPERSKQYFYYLNRLLSLKLSKVEFNKLCVRIVGRENIPLHNQFIRSILKNACNAKVPPPSCDNESPAENGSYAMMTQSSSSPGLSNGDILLPLSPRKARSALRDRRGGDRRSALGQNGKTNILENGMLTPIDIQRPLQHQHHHHHGLSQQSDGPVSVHSTDQANISVRGRSRSPLRAPLGVPYCPVSVGGARKALPTPPTTDKCVSALLDSVTLRERMEQIAIMHGLEGVSPDCANLLNNGLDAYLKGIIRSCIGLVGAKLGHEPAKNNTKKHHHQTYMKLANGLRIDNHFQMQSSGGPSFPISLQDFRVAMELNPHQLGEDWPLLLEKICINSYEE